MELCPICEHRLSQESTALNDVEIKQGGKNIFCRICKSLLWIPANGPPLQSVPLRLKFEQIKDPFPHASTILLERKGLLPTCVEKNAV